MSIPEPLHAAALPAAVLDALDVELAVLDAQGVIVYVNQAWCDFAFANGAGVEHTFLGSNYLQACGCSIDAGGTEAASVRGQVRAVLVGSLPEFRLEYPCDSPTEQRWFSMSLTPMQGYPGHFVVCHQNITATKQAALANELALCESIQRTHAVVEHMMDAVITIDSHGVILSFNQAATEIFGYSREEALKGNVHMLMSATHADRHDEYLANYHRTGVGKIIGQPRDVTGRRKDGAEFPMNIAISKIAVEGGASFVGIARDMSKPVQDAAAIHRLVYYDPLTGLPNRRQLLERLEDALHNPNPRGSHGAVIFIDLDHFKALNDTLGHAVGDDLLTQTAQRLRTCLPDNEATARLGSDEFVVVLQGLSIHRNESAKQAETLALTVLAALCEPFKLDSYVHMCTPSMGIALFHNARDGSETLLKQAEVAMHQAKVAGRQRVCFFDPAMQAAMLSHAELQNDIRPGLANGEFSLHYQAQVNRKGQCQGAEALLRWNHHSRGMVSPAQFIPLAEESGVICALGHWVLETACRQLVAWAGDPRTAVWTVSVNVSAGQFSQPSFVAEVARVLQQTGVNPKRLKLELTESMLAKDMEDLIDKMQAIIGLGVSFSLDDFGTGYSSLAYLKRLPLSQLKIDRAFVREVLTDPSDAVIARTVVALGSSLGMSVIAEGVETQEQCDFLAAAGCEGFQGYLFGRPVPALEFQRALSEPEAWAAAA